MDGIERLSAADLRAPFGVRFVAPLALASTLNPVNSSLISTAMVPIAQDLGASAADTAWLISALYLASAVAQPAMGKLADLLGPRRVLLAALLVVAVAGLVGLLSESLDMLIATRVLIGIGTSGAYPAAMRMFRDRGDALGAPPPRQAMAVLSLSSAAVAAVGPFLGGVLTAGFGWHAVFAINLPLALVAMALILLWAPSDQARAAAPGRLWAELDVIGLMLFAGFLSAAMLVLMHLAQPDWRAVAAAILLGAALGVWSWQRPAPFLDLRMLARNRALTLTYLRFGAIMMISYCLFYGFAQWMQGAGGYAPETAGLMTMPMSLLAAIGSMAAARTASIRSPFLISCGAALAGSVALSLLGHESAPWLLAAAAGLFGLAIGMAPTATQAAVYLQAPAGQTGSASGLTRTFGYLGSITAASLLALCFGQRPSDAGFHSLMIVLAATSVVLLVAVLLDRTLPSEAELRGRG
jgi:MFS family permease